MAPRKGSKGVQKNVQRKQTPRSVRKQSQPAAKRAAEPASSESIEQRLGVLAEQLGTLIGTVQNKAEDMVDREALGKELARVKTSASDLLQYVNSMAPSFASAGKSKRPTARASAAADRSGRGPVDAPGKRHRQPPPQERGNRHMNEPKGTQTAPAIVKSMRRGGRG
jgi:hypothetical protein